jgi:hypothetical protein
MGSSTSSSRSSRRIVGLVLLVIAVVALMERYLALRLGLVAPLLLGLAFLVWSLVARRVGLMIPGCILTGLGVGLLAERYLAAGVPVNRAAFFFGLGGGFLLISLLGRVVFREKIYWALIPGLVLAGIGAFHLGGADLRQIGRVFTQIWPFLLLLVAAWFLFSSNRR